MCHFQVCLSNIWLHSLSLWFSGGHLSFTLYKRISVQVGIQIKFCLLRYVSFGLLRYWAVLVRINLKCWDMHAHSLNPLPSWWKCTPPDPLLLSMFHFPPCELSLLWLCHSCLPPGVLGFSLLHFPYRFHSMALFALYPSGLSMWPIQHQALCFISHLTGCCPLCLQSSSLQIHLGHQFLRFL